MSLARSTMPTESTRCLQGQAREDHYRHPSALHFCHKRLGFATGVVCTHGTASTKLDQEGGNSKSLGIVGDAKQDQRDSQGVA